MNRHFQTYRRLQNELAGLSRFSGQRSEIEYIMQDALEQAKATAACDQDTDTLNQIAAIESQAARERRWERASVVVSNRAAEVGAYTVRPVVTPQDTLTFSLLVRHWIKIIDAVVAFCATAKISVENHADERDATIVSVTFTRKEA